MTYVKNTGESPVRSGVRHLARQATDVDAWARHAARVALGGVARGVALRRGPEVETATHPVLTKGSSFGKSISLDIGVFSTEQPLH